MNTELAKRKFSYLIVLLSLFWALQSKAQDLCGTPELSQEDVEAKAYFGNNKKLIEFLNKTGYEIPEGYFDSLDNKGRYKGRKVKLAEFKRKKREKNVKKKGLLGTAGLKSNSVLTETDYFIPLRIIVHQDANGESAYTNAEIMASFNEAERVFRTEVGNIFLYIDEVEVWFDSDYFIINNELEELALLNGISPNSSSNQITAHIVRGAPRGGRASFVPSREFYVRRGNWQESVFVHEIGHCLGLLHTHRGFDCLGGDNAECANCLQESVSRTRKNGWGCLLNSNRKKCEVNGDLLCDTPADPRIDFCPPNTVFIDGKGPNNQDNWGDIWQPDLFNVMSYADGCRDNLSLGQAGVMQYELYYNSKFSQFPHVGNTFINELIPNDLCPGDNILLTAPNSPNGYPNANYVWNVPNNWSVTTTNGGRVA